MTQKNFHLNIKIQVQITNYQVFKAIFHVMVGDYYELVNHNASVNVNFCDVFKRMNNACGYDLLFCIEQEELFNSARKPVQPDYKIVVEFKDDDDDDKQRSVPRTYDSTYVQPCVQLAYT